MMYAFRIGSLVLLLSGGLMGSGCETMDDFDSLARAASGGL